MYQSDIWTMPWYKKKSDLWTSFASKKERKKGMCQRQNERQYNTVLTHYSYLSYVSKGYFKNAG